MCRDDPSAAEFRLASEFADVEVHLDDSANGPRLRIVDRRSGAVNFLDPLEIESLVWATRSDLAAIVDPSARRWASPPSQGSAVTKE